MEEIVAYYRVSTKSQGFDGLGMAAQREAVGPILFHRMATVRPPRTSLRATHLSETFEDENLLTCDY
ncbi:MAG: hypothetical protein NVSMB64_10710 [Candidatus Velthaea sp.]